MDPVLAVAQSILRRHPAPALRMSELVERLRSEGPDARLESDRLRKLLERHPTAFRVLDLWRGPWRPLGEEGGALERDCWVAAATDRTDPPDDGGVAGLMRETVRWLARRVDVRSLHEVTRWQRLAMADEAVRARLPRRAA